MFTVNDIDKQHNGYVTRNELDDIIKMYLKQQLGCRLLNPIINKFCSIQNKILIDYNQFRTWVDKEFKKETQSITNKLNTEKIDKNHMNSIFRGKKEYNSTVASH